MVDARPVLPWVELQSEARCSSMWRAWIVRMATGKSFDSTTMLMPTARCSARLNEQRLHSDLRRPVSKLHRQQAAREQHSQDSWSRVCGARTS